MRQFILAALVIGAASGQTAAAETPMPNIDIVSVVPRSPGVKPYMMSLPAEGRPEHAAVAQKSANPQPESVTAESKSGQTTTVARN